MRERKAETHTYSLYGTMRYARAMRKYAINVTPNAARASVTRGNEWRFHHNMLRWRSHQQAVSRLPQERVVASRPLLSSPSPLSLSAKGKEKGMCMHAWEGKGRGIDHHYHYPHHAHPPHPHPVKSSLSPLNSGMSTCQLTALPLVNGSS